jgi:hypothetical protein
MTTMARPRELRTGSAGPIGDVKHDRRNEADERQQAHEQTRPSTLPTSRHACDRKAYAQDGDHGKRDCKHVQHDPELNAPPIAPS